MLPTLTIKNTGELVEQNADARMLSLWLITPFSFKSETSFAPIGNPAITLIKKAYPKTPLTLNTFFIKGEREVEILEVVFSWVKIAVIKK